MVGTGTYGPAYTEIGGAVLTVLRCSMTRKDRQKFIFEEEDDVLAMGLQQIQVGRQ